MDPTMTNDATAPPPDAAAILSNPDLDQTIPQQQPPTYQPPMPPISPASHIENYAAAVHHSRLSHALNTVADILGGPKTLRLQKNADGTVDMTQVDATPGEKWGRVAAAALQGAATGFAVGQGPGGAQRAAAASVQQGMAAPQQNQQNLIKEGERQENQNRQRMMFNANMAMQHQQLVKATFDNMKAPIEFSQEQTKFAVGMADTMNKMGASEIASYKDADELAAQFNSNTQLQQGHLGTAGMVLPVSSYGPDGKVTGGKIYYLPEDKRNQLNTVGVDIPFYQVDEKGKVTQTMHHVEPGQMTNDQIFGALTGSFKQSNDAAKQASDMKVAQEGAKARTDLVPSQQAENFAQAAAANASARKSNVEADLAPGIAAGKAGASQATLNLMERQYVKPARDVESAFQVADQTYNQYEALRKQGKDFPTGAQSMLLLSRHLQTTFGAVPGGRMTKSLIEEHLGARGVSDQVVTAFQRAYDGDALSPNQWKAFHGLIQEQRNSKWDEAHDALVARGIDPTPYLPVDRGGTPRTLAPTVAAAAAAPPAAAPGTAQAARAPGALPPAVNNPQWPVHSDGKGNFIQWNGTQYAPVAPPAK